MMRRLCRGGFGLSAITLSVLSLGSWMGGVQRSVQAQDDPSQPAYYTEKVQPILQSNCYRCHGGVNHRGGLNMDTREELLKGSHHGPAVVPGHPEQSWMVILIRHEGPADDPMNMPPAPKPKLADADIDVVTKWIKAGAAMPPTPAASAAPAASAPSR
jgi:cytochrome c